MVCGKQHFEALRLLKISALFYKTNTVMLVPWFYLDLILIWSWKRIFWSQQTWGIVWKISQKTRQIVSWGIHWGKGRSHMTSWDLPFFFLLINLWFQKKFNSSIFLICLTLLLPWRYIWSVLLFFVVISYRKHLNAL